MQKIGTLPVLCFDEKSQNIACFLDSKIHNTETISQWSGIDGKGNYFFSSVDMFMQMYAERIECALKTGIFLHDNEFIYHAWIEIEHDDEDYVLNVSNIHSKPAYIIKSEQYYQINNVQKIIQTINFKKMKLHLNTYHRNKGKDSVGEFAKFLLKPTLRLLKRYLKN